MSADPTWPNNPKALWPKIEELLSALWNTIRAEAKHTPVGFLAAVVAIIELLTAKIFGGSGLIAGTQPLPPQSHVPSFASTDLMLNILEHTAAQITICFLWYRFVKFVVDSSISLTFVVSVFCAIAAGFATIFNASYLVLFFMANRYLVNDFQWFNIYLFTSLSYVILNSVFLAVLMGEGQSPVKVLRPQTFLSWVAPNFIFYWLSCLFAWAAYGPYVKNAI